MTHGAPPDLVRVRDAASCRHWLAALPADAGQRLSAIDALLARLARPGHAADTLFEILDQTRIEQVRAIDECVAPLAGLALPCAEPEWQRLGRALASLRASRDLFKRAYSLMLGTHGDDTRSIILGATNALRVAMPLARALDAQARIVALLLRHRVAPLPADWEALCVLARHMRRTTFQDEALIDETPLVKPTTARALFVYPLLLRAAALPSRAGAEAGLAERLAARLAAKVGYRIDNGASESNPHGPTLVLGAGLAVRLDTHRLPASIARRRQQWLASTGEAVSRKPLPLGRNAIDALLEDLERRWTHVALLVAPGGDPEPRGDGAAVARNARLRFGLPRIHAADMLPISEARTAQAADAQYVYSRRWEQNTIMRVALGSDVDRGDPAALVMAEGEAVEQLDGDDAAHLLFLRHGSAPCATLGALVAIAPDSGLSLATVESIELVPGTGYLQLRGQRLGLRCWPGRPVPVGVKIGEALFFVDAWLLPGDAAAGRLPSLVLPPKRAHAGACAVLREPDGDRAVRFASLIERGPGYERLSLATDAVPPGPPASRH
ncbi:MAG: hypothetical protein KJZ98_05150 [Burkholderiaceae bacterium]|nr:hypothetical protein [Burkholderiaceae bacterium]MEB2352231.1 hypothetical protein [Burkholderiaceae bacterium]